MARKLVLTILLFILAGGSGLPASAQANAQKTFTVLVPPLENGTRTVSLFGDSVAQETLKGMARLDRYRGMSWEEANRAAPIHMKLPICIVARQVASLAGFDAVVCGTYHMLSGEEGVLVDLTIVRIQDQSRHDKTFKASSAAQAATVILQELSAFQKRD